MTFSSVTEPLVSVIIPTYNRRELLRRAVHSALEQTGVQIEVLICDDGSTDGTAQEWQDADYPGIRYFRLQHGGACAARNEGIRQAKGQYIAFLDSDDVWYPEKMKKQLHWLEEMSADAVACRFCRHDTDGTKTIVPDHRYLAETVDRKALLKENFISTQTIFGRTECIRAVMFDHRFPRMQDWDFVLNLSKRYKLCMIPEVLVDVFVQPDSISIHQDNALRALHVLFDKYREDYLADYDCMVAILDAMELYAVRCKKTCLPECFRGLNARWGMKKNLQLVIRCVKAQLRGMQSQASK